MWSFGSSLQKDNHNLEIRPILFEVELLQALTVTLATPSAMPLLQFSTSGSVVLLLFFVRIFSGVSNN